MRKAREDPVLVPLFVSCLQLQLCRQQTTMSSSPSSPSSCSSSDESLGAGEGCYGTTSKEFRLCTPEKILSFWTKMGADDSPLRVHHPLEHRCYRALSSAPVDLLNAFTHLLDENLSKCLVVDQRCSSNVDFYSRNGYLRSIPTDKNK